MRVGELFEQADADGNGVLDRKEFKAVFVQVSAATFLYSLFSMF